ncbi:Neuralized-like protein 4 [Chamberlinius hualienensis]
MASPAAISSMFHPRTAQMISLTNGNKTAQRNQPAHEYNNGIVLSLETLKDNQLFEVRIDKMINSWTGALAIGVTTIDPLTVEFPSSVVDLRESWIMSGTSVLKDGKRIVEDYGQNLDSLDEGSKVGVMKTTHGELYFFVNGLSLGLATTGIPSNARAVVDLYGKCCQVTIVDTNTVTNESRHNEVNNDNLTDNNSSADNDAVNLTDANANCQRLGFHEKTGSLIVLSNNGRSAERRRPFDEFNNGVVMTNRPLKNNELFEIRIDRLVDKWSGSIEVGVTTHSPATLQFPATMTNMRSGTIMMSGCGILTNGKGTRREYGTYNLDELSEGDRIGLMRKSDGSLVYYINGIDQGIAATNVPHILYGVVDLYGMTVKVSIIDRDEPHGWSNHRNNQLLREYQMFSGQYQLATSANGVATTAEQSDKRFDYDCAEKLLFHRRCGKNVSVYNGDQTAQRPSPVDNFDNAVVLTSRPLKANEMFVVQLDILVNKWIGSLEIGVTTHNPIDFDFPSTMTNVKSGTWMMTSNGVMHNGIVVLEDYSRSLDMISVGDHIGVCRKSNGALHFYLNGVDQGVAATNVPDGVYGAIDLFGQAAQATIVEQCDSIDAVCGNDADQTGGGVVNDGIALGDLCFHHLHGRNARLSSNGRTATRLNAPIEFNEAIVTSNRPLRDGEMFEVTIDKRVERWSGSLEAGVTTIRPEDLVFPSTMTDIDYDTWMLSGSSVMQDGTTVRNGYKCDLDGLPAGTRIGMMRCPDATLHYFINGEDMGVACFDIPPYVYAVIDLYGQCAQVSIVYSSSGHSCLYDSATSPQTHTETLRASVIDCLDVTHCFSPLCGKNITLSSNGMVAARTRGFNHGIVFGGSCLQPNELFEIQVQKVQPMWCGSLRIGLTTLRPSETYSMSALPTQSTLLSSGGDTWLVSSNKVYKNGLLLLDNYGISLDWLEVSDRVGIKRCADATLHIFRNGEDGGAAVADLPKGVYVVLDLYGAVEKVSIVSKVLPTSTTSSVPPLHLDSTLIKDRERERERRLSIQSEHSRDSLECDLEELNLNENQQLQPTVDYEFHDNHGTNIILSDNMTTARRSVGYNYGLVFSKKPLTRGQLFQVRIERLNSSWSSSLMVGVSAHAPDKQPLAASAFALRKPFWLICSDNVFHNGLKVKGKYSFSLDHLQQMNTVGLLIDNENSLHLYINGADQGIAANDLSPKCYAFIDIYGQCEEVKICSSNSSVEANQREKGDFEHKGKEKSLRLIPAVKNCEYQKACIRFKWNLGLPDGYFSNDVCTCYCDNCYKLHGDVAYQRKGEPPRDYSVPFGWCQFRLKLPLKDEISGMYDKWHVAFHGTHPSIIRRILDNNELVLLEDAGLCATTKQRKSQKNKSKDADVEANQICFSPTIRYAASNYLTPKFEFFDAKSKKKLYSRAVFQLLVQPGSYNSGPQRIGAREPIDCHFSNNDIEWLTKEKGSILLHSLLIRIENI